MRWGRAAGAAGRDGGAAAEAGDQAAGPGTGHQRVNESTVEDAF